MKMLAIIAVAAMALPAGQTSAQPASLQQSDWQIGLGAAAIATPRAIGSSKIRYLAVPTFDIRYGDWAFFDPIKGLGVQAKPVAGVTASAAVGVSLDSRRERDDARYRGLGNITEAPALILGLDYELGDAFVNTSVRSRLGHGSRRGTLLDVDAGYNFVTSRSVLVSAGLTARAMDRIYARNFLGVDAAQAAASGLPAFDAGSGLQRAGLFAQTVYRASDDWTIFGRLESAWLRGDAGRSPVIERRQQTTFIVSVVRSF